MGASGDLINFDVIEGQKENIQSLPGGRSAKKLAALYSPTPLQSLSTPTPTDTRNVNDCIRAEYEAEIQNISESDDPLDVYDRYVRWTLDAYPSAQATPQSQLHTLLERATKAFISSTQYKNDPRYLKLWLHYIQFFTDAPRETYVYLSRHGIGESLALFYEEYGAWLEDAGKWSQAEEVYKHGIEREARPVQRLLRKFKEFEERLAQNPDAADAPSSPALPTVRPALVTKTDPFGASSRPADPQAPRPNNGIGSAAGKPAKSKLTIFSDADAKPSVLSAGDEGSKGWETIDSLSERKKENVMEPKPWVGEKLQAGGTKPAAAKMAVFRDPSLAQIKNIVVVPSKNQVMVHPQTGKKEYIFVDLAAVYPTPEEPGTEVSFEEIIARNRGWLDCAWEDETMDENRVFQTAVPLNEIEEISSLAVHKDVTMYDENGAVIEQHSAPKAGKKKKLMEVNETQIIKAKLDSPSGPKMRKKNMSEPTMTIHTRVATDDIYDIFNAPLKPVSQDANESGDEDDYETDGDYTTDVESTTGATKNIEPREHGEDEMFDTRSVSEWSEFSNGRHVPNYNGENEDDIANHADDNTATSVHFAEPHQQEYTKEVGAHDEEEELHTPVMNQDSPPKTRTVFVPIPPEDYDPPTRPYRDPAEVANNRLPFMTPITERTEVSLDMDDDFENRADQYKTPCRRDDHYAAARHQSDLEPLSSPLRDIVEDDFPAPKIPDSLQSKPVPLAPQPAKPLPKKGPIIKDVLCNPMDGRVRGEILSNIQPPLSLYRGYHDHSNEQCERSGQIRRFIKALSVKTGKANGERTGSLPPQVLLEFPSTQSSYTVKKELGAGAFAPVYLVENDKCQNDGADENSVAVMGEGTFAVNQRSGLEALKMEDPPSPWEFYMMRLAHSRLGPQHRVSASLSHAHELHLYEDEAYLFLPYHPNGTLLDVVNHFHTESSGVMDEQLAMFFAIELLRTVEGLHSKNFLHGDLKADNCLLRLDALPSGQQLSSKWRADGSGGWSSRGVSLIDFGRSIDMKAFVPNVEFFADWKTSEQDCAEMREARPWTWQIDYYGLAGTIHCLLFGKYIETARCDQGGIGKHRRYKIRECLKRYWQVDIWAECFDMLLNPGSFIEQEDGGSMPVLKSMKSVREKMERWLETNSERGVGLKSLMSKLDTYAKNRK